MSNYRRANTPGGTYFFTVVTQHRQPILTDDPIRTTLRAAIDAIRQSHPFGVDAWVLLPDHLHCIWTLPADDANFGLRWARIKQHVSRQCSATADGAAVLSPSSARRGESGLWQRRFWEHEIRDEDDFRRHADYIHWNPVKHGYVKEVGRWPFRRFTATCARACIRPIGASRGRISGMMDSGNDVVRKRTLRVSA
jgi:putative transposase